jgi:hypothetical protein
MNRARLSLLGAAAFALVLCALLVTAAGRSTAQDAVPHAEFGLLPLRGYELREHRFDPPFRIPQEDGTVKLETSGWQVVIKGDAFPVRALDPILWVDDVPLTRYERCTADGANALSFAFFDPTLLRSEHVMQVIYNTDERTRTKMFERLDPEKLIRLPDAERKGLAFPELEGVTLQTVAAAGHVAGRGRLASGEARLAARLANGQYRVLAVPVKFAADGTFAVDVGPLPKETTHVAALYFAKGTTPVEGVLAALPKGVELLDMKPLGTQPSAH